jgi:hypothetical protein
MKNQRSFCLELKCRVVEELVNSESGLLSSAVDTIYAQVCFTTFLKQGLRQIIESLDIKKRKT